ncbi:MAG: response regulator [Chloroflexi bacterium]|nr:response regulator [Chloroflexota bacterium]
MTDARILVVDDDPSVRDIFCDILDNAGYAVTAAGSATEALLKAKTGSFDLLIADIKMPDMSGLELIKRFRELDRHIMPLLITGYPSAESIATAIGDDIADYIIKPVGKVELCTVVASALQKRQLASKAVEPKTITSDTRNRTTSKANGTAAKVVAACIGSGLSAALLLALGSFAAISTSMLLAILATSAMVPLALAGILRMHGSLRLKARGKQGR